MMKRKKVLVLALLFVVVELVAILRGWRPVYIGLPLLTIIVSCFLIVLKRQERRIRDEYESEVEDEEIDEDDDENDEEEENLEDEEI